MVLSSGIINSTGLEQVLKNIHMEIHSYENTQDQNGGCFDFPDAEHPPEIMNWLFTL